MKLSKNTYQYILTVFLSCLLLWLGWMSVKNDAHLFQNTSGSDSEEALCRVLEITDDDQTISNLGDMYYLEQRIEFDAEILRGPHKGEIISAEQLIDNVSTLGVQPVEAGDKLFVYSPADGTDGVWSAGDFYRSGQITLLLGFFCLALLLFGQKKGFNTMLSLAFTCGAVFLVFVPSILAGRNPYLWS